MIGFVTILIGCAHVARTEVTLTDLTRHPGLMAFKERETKIIKSHHIHLHTIQLETFQSCFDNLRYTLKSLENNDDAKEFQEVLKIRMQGLLESFHKIQPITRPKRGLLNPLGSIIKSITGNMDYVDFVDIHKKLNEYETKTNEVIQGNEQQIRINNDLESKINAIVNHLNDQQVQIMREIAALKNRIPTDKNILFRQIFHKLLFNIDILERQLVDIFESIQMSKLGVLPRAILSQNETLHVLELLENQEIHITNFDQIYEYLNVHTLHNTTCIIFAIQIPIFTLGKFQYVIFESIPMNDRAIVTNFDIAVLGKNVTYASKTNCQIIEQYRVCRQKQLIDISDDQCISNALQGQEASCDYTEPKNKTEVVQINSYTVIIKSALNPITINSDTCGLSTRQITGTVMITFQKCSLVINGTQYDAEETMSQHKLTLIPMLGINFQEKTFSKEFDLQQLSTMHITNRDHVRQLQIHQETFQKFSVGSLLLVLSVLVFFAVRLRKTAKTKPTKANANKEDSNTITVSAIQLEETSRED